MTPDALRARFAGTALPEDPLDVMMPPGLKRWPHKMREMLAGPLRPAGVLVPLGVEDCVRASVCHYNTVEEVERFLAAVARLTA